MISIEKIPGMIEPVEQNLLVNLASNTDLSKGVIVEFGTYFGKSTACLITGVLNNSLKISNKIHLYSYDSFEAIIGCGFDKYIFKHAKMVKLENALFIDNNKVNFRAIYDYYLSTYEGKILKTTEMQIKDLKIFNENIQLIFIDCPKTFKNFIYIFDNFFTKLNLNSIIVFQDYFYPWSSSLIAFIQLLLNDKKIEIKGTAASSLVVELIDKIEAPYIKKIKDIMERDNLNLLLQQSRNNFAPNNMDRFYQFCPRLILAQLQYAYHNNGTEAVNEIMKYFLSDINFINLNTLNDLSELISKKFNIDAGIE
jgi:hypothetical protein